MLGEEQLAFLPLSGRKTGCHAQGCHCCVRYLGKQGLVAMQQAVSLAGKDVALGPAITLVQAGESCKAAPQVLSLLTNPAACHATITVTPIIQTLPGS